MAARGRLRGHPIYWDTVVEMWRYSDTDESTEATHKDRACGYCGMRETPEGHDACLGTLPNVMNACCGHGEAEKAYIQRWDRTVVRGQKAADLIQVMLDGLPNT